MVAEADDDEAAVAIDVEMQAAVGGVSGVFSGVVDEVEQDLLDGGGVGADGQVGAGGDFETELHVGVVGACGEAGGEVVDERWE